MEKGNSKLKRKFYAYASTWDGQRSIMVIVDNMDLVHNWINSAKSHPEYKTAICECRLV